MVKTAEELNSPDSGMPEFCFQCCFFVSFFVLRGLAIKKIKNMVLEHLDLWKEVAWRQKSKKYQQGKDPPGRGGGRPIPLFLVFQLLPVPLPGG